MSAPVSHHQQQHAPLQQAALSSHKQLQYLPPIVTYAQPIVQRLETAAPKLADQSYTAKPIVQRTYQTAPEQRVQAITATAPTISKGYGAAYGLGSAPLMQWQQEQPVSQKHQQQQLKQHKAAKLALPTHAVKPAAPPCSSRLS